MLLILAPDLSRAHKLGCRGFRTYTCFHLQEAEEDVRNGFSKGSRANHALAHDHLPFLGKRKRRPGVGWSMTGFARLFLKASITQEHRSVCVVVCVLDKYCCAVIFSETCSR